MYHCKGLITTITIFETIHRNSYRGLRRLGRMAWIDGADWNELLELDELDG